ncbi:CPBP family intramembrane glutamic endopeptidase [Flavobacterium sp. SM2513]|uniref:CPBP family intramembrane glutamic endopeptidase n=1 Tax=Flavobacterium sp. SM2513 TaxID=3424766 RepID=UPI003D7F9C40
MIAIDVSFIICIILSFRFLKINSLSSTPSNTAVLYFILFSILSFLWFLVCPLFKIDQQQWSIDLTFTTRKITDVTTNPTFFTVYGLLRLLVIVPVLEELFYRKLIFSSLLEKHGVYISIIISSLLFSIGHFDFNNSIIFFIFGILLGATYWKTRNLYYPILMHICINAMTLFFV